MARKYKRLGRGQGFIMSETAKDNPSAKDVEGFHSAEKEAGLRSCCDLYELANATLSASTTTMIKFYAKRSHLGVHKIDVDVTFERGKDGASGAFHRKISVTGRLNDLEKNLLLRAADRCPVGIQLAALAIIKTNIEVIEPNDRWGVEGHDSLHLVDLEIPNVDPD